PVRILKNQMSIQYLKLEQENAPRDEMEKLTLGGLRRAVFDGDMKNGSVMIGQVAGMCREVRPMQDILDNLIKESQEEIVSLQNKIKELVYEN
ncbi:MAG: enoyl-[acyl-carrier-protein] reductase FabK, partial [Longicatena sp.]